MRNMSFSLTTQQYEARTKTVTRRVGWGFLKPGDVVMGIVKGMGLKKGEKVQKLHPFRVKSNTPEPLSAIRDYPNDCELEGFPEMTPDEFVEMFTKHNRVTEDRVISRIEFEHLPDTPLTEAFAQLREVMGKYYDGIDADEYVRQLRAD